jgi:hypothetical protein
MQGIHEPRYPSLPATLAPLSSLRALAWPAAQCPARAPPPVTSCGGAGLGLRQAHRRQRLSRAQRRVGLARGPGTLGLSLTPDPPPSSPARVERAPGQRRDRDEDGGPESDVPPSSGYGRAALSRPRFPKGDTDAAHSSPGLNGGSLSADAPATCRRRYGFMPSTLGSGLSGHSRVSLKSG